jgi:hypothetical protein
MKSTGEALVESRAIWLSRYTGVGPRYDASWTSEGGSLKWKMPPLPDGASYPADQYSTAHFWQFSESGVLPSRVFSCGGSPVDKSFDMDWAPVSKDDHQTLFGTSSR